MDGTWYTHDWGTIKLTQAAGQQEVTGKTRGWDIGGFVSGKRVVLYFKSSGIVYYSAELTPKGDDALSGPYATGQLSGSPKTKEIELTRRK